MVFKDFLEDSKYILKDINLFKGIDSLFFMSRKISVGFIEPKLYSLEENTIYVTLIPHSGGVRAEAVSREEFFFLKNGGMSKETKGNNYLTSSIREGVPIYTYHWDFVKMLEKENDGKRDDYRMETDGLKLAELVQETHYKTGIVKTF